MLDKLDRDADRKKRELLARLQRLGSASREEQEGMMAQMEDALVRIGDMLQRDEQDQDALLKRKLEERANRRKKLQEKLAEQEKKLEMKKEVFEDRKEEIEQRAQEQIAKLEEELAGEKR